LIRAITAFVLLPGMVAFAIPVWIGYSTLAPGSPPRRLVTSGPYRFCRKPMYLAMATILVGCCLLWDTRTLIYYALVSAAVFHLRVRRCLV
jgi:protein-S-isoprenylcysteine O-methyltransferase Ste14